MRAYTVADVFAVADLLGAVVGNGSKLGSLMKVGETGDNSPVNPEAESERGIALVSYLLGECLSKCQEKLVSWFASLNEMSVEEFKSKPPELVLETIEAVATRKESKDFFAYASQLYRKIGGSGKSTKNK